MRTIKSALLIALTLTIAVSIVFQPWWMVGMTALLLMWSVKECGKCLQMIWAK